MESGLPFTNLGPGMSTKRPTHMHEAVGCNFQTRKCYSFPTRQTYASQASASLIVRLNDCIDDQFGVTDLVTHLHRHFFDLHYPRKSTKIRLDIELALDGIAVFI